MAFIDGENLVARYQAMLAEGRVPSDGVLHKPDAYVWHGGFQIPGSFEPVRAFYYTSVVGDDDKVASVARELRQMPFGSGGYAPAQCFLYPRVFKRPAGARKTSVADIQLAVDMLAQVYQANVDTVILLSGDGDFRAVVREVAARGRRIYVGSFSSGRHPQIEDEADRAIDLDPLFFRTPGR